MTAKPTIVLVPGAWHFPQCFDLFVQHLQAKDYPTRTVAHASVYKDEPPKITGHKDDAQAIRDVVIPLIQEGREVIVFCHSYGGWPTTEALAGLSKAEGVDAAAANKTGGVVHIVYCAAFVGKEGECQIEMNMNNKDGWDGRWLNFADDMSKSWVNKEHAIWALYGDVPLELAEKMVDHLGDMVGTAAATPLENCAWRDISSTYIVCEKDNAIFALFQERMCKRVGIEDVVKLSGSSHSPFLSQPEKLVQIIDRVVEQKSSML